VVAQNTAPRWDRAYTWCASYIHRLPYAYCRSRSFVYKRGWCTALKLPPSGEPFIGTPRLLWYRPWSRGKSPFSFHVEKVQKPFSCDAPGGSKAKCFQNGYFNGKGSPYGTAGEAGH